MKITKTQLRQLIKEEIMKEYATMGVSSGKHSVNRNFRQRGNNKDMLTVSKMVMNAAKEDGMTEEEGVAAAWGAVELNTFDEVRDFINNKEHLRYKGK